MNRFTRTFLFVLPALLTIAPSLGITGTILRFLAGGIALVLTFIHWHKIQPEMKRGGLVAVTILVACLIIATLASPSLIFGISRFLNWALFLPLFFLCRNLAYALEPFLKGILLASGAQMAGVLLQIAGLIGGLWGGQIISGVGYDPIYSQWLIRYTGFVLDANSLGMIFAIAAITSLYYSTQRSLSNWVRILYFLFAMTNLFSILLTGSRGGILITVISLFAFLVLSRKFSLLLRLVPALILVTMAGIQFAGFEFLINSIFAIFDGTDTSANLRTELWQFVLSRNGDLTIFTGQGFGARNPGFFVDQKSILVDPALLRLTTVDNSWLKTYIEIGGIAVLAIAWLFFRAIRQTLVNLRSRSDISALQAALLILFLIRSFSVDAFDINPWNSVIWIILGSMMVPIVSDKLGQGTIERADWRKN